MCVLFCVSMKTGSMWRTMLVFAVTASPFARNRKTVVESSFGTFGVSGVALTRCSKYFVPSAQILMIQSAGSVVPPHAPHDAHHCTVIGPPSRVGPARFQIQFGS